MSQICIFPNCGYPTLNKKTEYCNGHRLQASRGEVLKPITRYLRRYPLICSVDDCEQPSAVKGMCFSHAGQKKSKGFTTPIIKYGPTCLAPDCDKQEHSKGYCSGHYMQLQRGVPITPLATSPFVEVNGVIVKQRCIICKIEKPLDNYHRSKDTKSGRARRCKECAKNASRNWGKTESGKQSRKQAQHKRRVANKSVSYKISTKDWKRLSNAKCVYCLIDPSGQPANHLDHIVPISRGGNHSIGNVQKTCEHHNLSKHTMLHIEYIHLLQKL